MKVLIIGNLGYVGPVVVDHLTRHAKKNHQVWGYDIGFFSGNETLTGNLMPETRLAAQYYGDVRNFDPLLLDSFDAVVYLAAISNDPMGNAFEKPTREINHTSAVRIAKEAKNRGVKSFVFASSCSVYGLADTTARTEDSELNPLTAYARSKIGAETDLKPLADNSFSVTCLRFATACGFSSRLRLDLVLNDFVASAIASGKIQILSDGTPWRPLIDVRDMALAIEWAITNSQGYLVVNAGSNEWNFQVAELAREVQKIIPDTEISVNSSAPPDNRSYKVDFSLYKKLAPDFYPRRTLSDTIEALYSGLNDLNFNNKDFRNSTLIRLRTLNDLLASRRIDQDLKILN